MGTTILSFEDRVVIETLHHEKHSLQYIADYLGFSKTTALYSFSLTPDQQEANH